MSKSRFGATGMPSASPAQKLLSMVSLMDQLFWSQSSHLPLFWTHTSDRWCVSPVTCRR